MPVPTLFDLERSELEKVLASELFSRSPNLAKILQYLCLKYFEGQEHVFLKEYNIGVEALGRPPGFDPKHDSIVRVEAHRLREKLKRYYETEGANHRILINVHAGSYVPQFLRRDEASQPAPGHEVSEALCEPFETARDSGNGELVGQERPLVAPHAGSAPGGSSEADVGVPRVRWHAPRLTPLVTFGLFVVFIGIGALANWRRKSETVNLDIPLLVKASAPVAAGWARDVRILAGYSGKEYVDRLGNAWGPDQYFSGGAVLAGPQVFIARSPDSRLFETAREGEFSYNIPLKPRTYELRLYFVETTYGPGTHWGGGETTRLFHIDMNGNRLFTDFDVISDAGGNNIADVRVLKDVSPGPDGYLHLKFTKATGLPVISALEIVPSQRGKIHPIRIVTDDHTYTDQGGQLWSSDRYFSGGRLATHHQPTAGTPDPALYAGIVYLSSRPSNVEGTPDPGLYAGERYGHFSYAIPVAEGRYLLTLRFAETFFGPHKPGRGGVGSRIFDVYCNGVALLRNFDILKEAGGENRAVEKTFHRLQPNAQGKLMLSFVPIRNYASVKAIEVVDESK